MTAHTQGPWVAACTGPDAFVIHPEHHTVWVVAKAYKQEDARLIAAAPDLLAALLAIAKEAGDWFGHDEGPGTINRMAFHARQAINKATGETK